MVAKNNKRKNINSEALKYSHRLVNGAGIKALKGIRCQVSANIRPQNLVKLETVENLKLHKGYVQVDIKPGKGSAKPTIVKVNKNKKSSIGLFIAGGKDVDEKIAQANAALRTNRAKM